MFPDISGSNQAFLASLDTTQLQMQQSQSEVSSGLRVQQASDDPTEIAEILQLQGDISQNQQIQSNLNGVSSELGTADSALQTAVQAVESATSLGTQGATSTATADQRTILAQQVTGILQTLVGIANTSMDGRSIFSGRGRRPRRTPRAARPRLPRRRSYGAFHRPVHAGVAARRGTQTPAHHRHRPADTHRRAHPAPRRPGDRRGQTRLAL